VEREKTASKLLAQMRGEALILVPETADGFRASIGALRSLGENKGVSFHTSHGGPMRAPTSEERRQAHGRGRD
jgi:hypothetical protein